MAFCPSSVPTNYELFDVDHIDGTKRNEITNLQWLDKSSHSKKTRIQTKRKRKPHGPSIQKRIRITQVPDNSNHKIGTIFDGIKEAEKLLGINNVSRSIKRDYSTHGYKFEFVSPNLFDDEKFIYQTDYSKDKYGSNVFASQYGRVINNKGIKTSGNIRKDEPYPYIKLNDKQRRIHIVIWECFFGEVPDSMVIMHPDHLPEQTRFRNYISDLRLGTKSQNLTEYYKHDGIQRCNRIKILESSDPGEVGMFFRTAEEAAKFTGLSSSTVTKSARAKRKCKNGYRFLLCQ
jgi:hypothetical protein